MEAGDVMNILNKHLAGKFMVNTAGDEVCTIWKIDGVILRHSGPSLVDMVLLSQWEANGRFMLVDLASLMGETEFTSILFATADAARAEAKRIDDEGDEEE